MTFCSNHSPCTCPNTVLVPDEYNAAIDILGRHAGTYIEEKIAVIDEQGCYTYIELIERINRAGNALLNLGLEKGSKVAMALLDNIDFPSVFWGCIKSGIVPIPLNTQLPSSDYQYILDDSQVEALIVSEPLLEKFEPLKGSLPHLKTIVVSGKNESYPLLSNLMNDVDPELTPAPTRGDDIAFWLYSSGSTGKPKGVMHRHSSLVNTAVLYGVGIIGMTASDRVYSAAKLFFAYGLGNAMTIPFYVGATSVLYSGRPTPDAVMNIIRQHQPTIYFGVPSLYAGIMADHNNRPEPGSHSLRVCISAGEALPEEIGRKCHEWFGVPVLDGIGSTEMLHIFLSNRPDDVVYGSSGKPVPGYQLKLVNEEDKEVAPGDMGELVCNGPSSAMGYWNKEEKSRKTFRGRWTYTGDKYVIDDDGYYHYCGRTDDMIKVGGQWVSPFEVESTIMEHDAVVEVAVVGQEDEYNLVKPKAYVVLRTGIEKKAGLVEDIQVFVKSRIAKHKYPRWIEFVDSLPRTTTGKIQRFKLR